MIRREIVGHFSARELSAMVGQIHGAPVIREGPRLIEGPEFMMSSVPIEYFELKVIIMTEECWYDLRKDNNAVTHGLSDFHCDGPITFQGFLIAVTQSWLNPKQKWIQFHE